MKDATKAALNSIAAEVRMILTCLLIVFITLKLTGLVEWSWAFVLFPFWIPLCVLMLAIVSSFLYYDVGPWLVKDEK